MTPPGGVRTQRRPAFAVIGVIALNQRSPFDGLLWPAEEKPFAEVVKDATQRLDQASSRMRDLLKQPVYPWSDG